MVDIHTHILPIMDDGAKTPEKSAELLKLEFAQGIDTVVLSSHFNIEDESISSFTNRRQKSFAKLLSVNSDIKLLTGAEVRYSPKLYKTDLSELCIENTRYILIELPYYERPFALNEVMRQIIESGYQPVITHPERYDRIDKKEIYRLVDSGVLMQISAGSFCFAKERKRCIDMIKHNLVHFLASDAHSPDRRPPRFDLAKTVLLKNSVRRFMNFCLKTHSCLSITKK